MTALFKFFSISSQNHRPITLVMGKISYKGKARIETLQKLGFGYRTIVANFWKMAGSFAQ